MLQKGVCSLLASFRLLCAYQLCWEMTPDRRTCHGLSIYHLELNPRLGMGNDFTLRYEHFQSQFLLMPVVVKHRTFRGHELLLPTVQRNLCWVLAGSTASTAISSFSLALGHPLPFPLNGPFLVQIPQSKPCTPGLYHKATSTQSLQQDLATLHFGNEKIMVILEGVPWVQPQAVFFSPSMVTHHAASSGALWPLLPS